jgi:hypothetical protein
VSVQPIELLGGESVYCISAQQLTVAGELAFRDARSARRIQKQLADAEQSLDRNERAALAFVLIDRLLRTPADAA